MSDDTPADAGPLTVYQLPAYGVHDGANVVVCTPELADMFGATAEGVVGRAALEFIAPEGRDEVIEAILMADGGTAQSRGLRRDGTTFPIEVTAFEVRFRKGRARLFTVRDLSPLAIVVDDEEIVKNLISALLKMASYQTIAFSSPTEALRAYRPGMASLLVTDVSMAEMNGVAFAERIREADPGLPVVFVSGFAEMIVPQNQTTAFVGKPFTISALQAAIESLPARARAPLR